MSARRKRAKASHERWLVSYADFITLLFAFFVVLYAVSKSESQKGSEVSASIDSAMKELSVLPALTRSSGPGNTNDLYAVRHLSPQVRVISASTARSELEQVRDHLQRALGNQIAANIVSLHVGPNGLVIRLHEAGFFNSGSADPLPQSIAVLRTISSSLSDTPYEVRVEGHTDNVPIHNVRFASNWELSAARASSIARLLLMLRCVPPDHLSVAGYGEFQPVASNASAAGRSQNRRVDIVVFPRVQLGDEQRTPMTSSAKWKTILEADRHAGR